MKKKSTVKFTKQTCKISFNIQNLQIIIFVLYVILQVNGTSFSTAERIWRRKGNSKVTALDKIRDIGVLPVIKIEKTEYAVPLADALRKGGINAIEVTCRNESALSSVNKIKEAFPDMTVGAGTILSAKQAEQAKAAGIDFIVSPGYNPETVTFCVENDMPIVPGCVTPAEIETAMAAGLDTVKFFPAEINGGVEALKAFSGPFPKLSFVPTGGIDFGNLGTYLSHSFVAACGGSFMAKADLIKEGQWEKITENCKKAVAVSLGFELAHVGINNENKEEALANADAMNRAFPLGVKIGSGKSSFLGTAVELMHRPYYGEKGHICFKTNSPERAKAFFEKQGLGIKENSISRNDKGEIKFFYLKDEIGGFALHVVKK